MSHQTMTPPRRPSEPGDAGRVSRNELEWRIRELEEQVRRLERERREFRLLADARDLGDDERWRRQVQEYLRERQERLVILRDGRICPPGEVPPEAILDLQELTRWRSALAEAVGLQSLLFLRHDIGFREANNSPLQIPALLHCPADCRVRLAELVQGWAHRLDLAVPDRCPGCGAKLTALPLVLEDERERAVLGWLVAHDLPAPGTAHRRLLGLVASWASRRASDEYRLQLHMVQQMTLVAIAAAHSERQREEADRIREALLERTRDQQALTAAKRELEEAYAQASRAIREAERTNRNKSLFLAAMSHEIRTPLTCVIGFADLLTLPTISQQEAAEFAQSIKRSGQVLLSLINNILDLTKIEAGRLELDRQPYRPAAVVRDVVEILGPGAREKGLYLRTECDPDLPDEAVGDATRLGQILMNLVGNAVKFTRQGGVTVRCRAEGEAAEWLVLEVEDTGEGIPAHLQERIFEPFTQLGGEKARQAGTGLGLAIARQLSRTMGGELTVESEPGRGARFICRIPRVLPESAGSDDDSGAAADPGSR